MTSSNPAAELVLLVTGYRVSQAIHVAATLGIADIIKDGAGSAFDLAVATNSHVGALYRVLRALAAAGVFHEDDKKQFSLTPLGECLRSDAERPIAACASFVGRPHQWQAWGTLSHSVRTGENAYRHVHGVGLWDYLVEHPEEAVIFDRAMTDGSRGVVEAIVSAYNFSAFGRVVDIGGGQGMMIAAVLAAHTNTHGVLFDRRTSWHGRNLYWKRRVSPDGAPWWEAVSSRPFPRVATHTCSNISCTIGTTPPRSRSWQHADGYFVQKEGF